VLDENSKVNKDVVGRSLVLKVFEHNLSSEVLESFINDIVFVVEGKRENIAPVRDLSLLVVVGVESD